MRRSSVAERFLAQARLGFDPGGDVLVVERCAFEVPVWFDERHDYRSFSGKDLVAFSGCTFVRRPLGTLRQVAAAVRRARASWTGRCVGVDFREVKP